MASFKKTRNAIAVAYDAALINEEEFALLYDISRSKNNLEIYSGQNWYISTVITK